MIIFNNNTSPQTADLVFEQGGYYVKDGLFGIVTTTGIKSLSPLTSHPSPLNVWYDLQGRRLSGKPTTKGVYIHGGKKLVVR
jgi:alpha-amylase